MKRKYHHEECSLKTCLNKKSTKHTGFCDEHTDKIREFFNIEAIYNSKLYNEPMPIDIILPILLLNIPNLKKLNMVLDNKDDDLIRLYKFQFLDIMTYFYKLRLICKDINRLLGPIMGKYLKIVYLIDYRKNLKKNTKKIPLTSNLNLQVNDIKYYEYVNCCSLKFMVLQNNELLNNKKHNINNKIRTFIKTDNESDLKKKVIMDGDYNIIEFRDIINDDSSSDETVGIVIQ